MSKLVLKCFESVMYIFLKITESLLLEYLIYSDTTRTLIEPLDSHFSLFSVCNPLECVNLPLLRLSDL